MATRKHAERRPQTDNRRPPTASDLTGLPAPAALPEEWHVARLGDVSEKPQYGYTAPATQQSVGPKMLRITDIQDGHVNWNAVPYCECSREDLEKYALHTGDIVFARTGSVGKAFLITQLPENVVFASYLIRVRVSEDIDPEYCYFFMQSPSYWQQITLQTHGAVQPNVNATQLRSLLLPLPPLPEQRAIARVLSTLQRAIETQDKLIAAARQVKKALMRHLFTYGAVPPTDAARVPLKETEIGAVPEGWEVEKLGDVCEKPQYGYTESATTKPVGPKFLRITDIQDGGVNWPLVPYCEISESFFEKYALKDGDLVVARIGATTGKSYFISNPPRSVFASYLIRVRAKMKLSPEYLRYFANTENYWKQINESKGGRLKQGINLPILTGLRLQLPPLPEQHAIARILSAVDKKIATEEKRKAALQTLLKTTLHQLMTGQMRVKAEG